MIVIYIMYELIYNNPASIRKRGTLVNMHVMLMITDYNRARKSRVYLA